MDTCIIYDNKTEKANPCDTYYKENLRFPSMRHLKMVLSDLFVTFLTTKYVKRFDFLWLF